ncbi:MAG: amidohydrolase family protein, partial [Deltaproteobacteria bacterium]|nr:amidohydrolase family protein [Deltaproteobacteria bacterium]
MSLERYKAKCLFYQGRFQENIILEVSDGTILRIASKENFKGQTITNLGNVALLPGTVNTHNHSFQSLVRGFGDDKPFVEWRDRGIYQYSLNLTKDDIYTGALFAFGEMLKHGITTVCDFFYIQDKGNENAKAVIRAAKDLGIRLVLARCFYDWQTGPKRYQEKPKEARARCLELMKEYEKDPMVTIIP